MQLDKKLLTTLLGYFVRGLLLIVPFALTIYIISIALNLIDGFVGIRFPGLGILILLSSITLLGYLGSMLLVKSAFDAAEGFVKKLPLVSTIYSSLKELIFAFVGKEKKFDKPVLILFDRTMQLKRLGFVTQQDLSQLGLTGSIAVYVPHSYNLSGDLYILPKEAVTPLDASSAEIMKFIVSGGVASVQNLPKAPLPASS